MAKKTPTRIKQEALAKEVFPKTDDIHPISKIPHYINDGISATQDGYYLVDVTGRRLTDVLPLTLADYINEALVAYYHYHTSTAPEMGKRGRLIGSIMIPANPITKKNSQQIIRTKRGYSAIIPSAIYQRALSDITKMGKTIWTKEPPDGLLPIASPVCITALYYRDSHRRVDITNCESALCDILVSIGILEDDNSSIVVCTDGSRVLYDKESPRTEVFIYEWKYPKEKA